MRFVESRKNIFWIPLIIAIVSLSVFALAVVFHWMGEAVGIGSGFCEAGHDGLIKQPINTISNIGFVIVGLIIAWSQAKGSYAQNKNLFTSGKFFAIFFASLAVLIGPGSMAMHATSTIVGGFFDLLSMYLIASFIFAYALSRFFQWKSIGFTIMFLIAMSIQLYSFTLSYEMPFVGPVGRLSFGLFLILTAIIELYSYFTRRIEKNLIFGLLTILVMVIASFIWDISKTGQPWCDPNSLIQGHGFWHLLTALAIYFLYRFYVSEQIISEDLSD